MVSWGRGNGFVPCGSIVLLKAGGPLEVEPRPRGPLMTPGRPKAGAPEIPSPPRRQPPKARSHTYFGGGWPPICDRINTLGCQVDYTWSGYEFGVASAVKFRVKFLGLVKSAGLVVGHVDPGQRRKYRGLVRAVPPISRTAGRQSRQHLRHRAHAPAQRGLSLWLRIQIVPSARGCSADLPVRHLAVERYRRPFGCYRGRNLLRGAVGDYPAPAGQDDGIGHHPERRLGDRAVDPDCRMLLVVCGVDHPL